MPPSAFDATILQIGSVATSGKGAKSAPISLPGDKPAYWQPKVPLLACYEPSAYQNADATRVNAVLRPAAEHEAELKALDEWCLSFVAENSERLVGRAQSIEQLSGLYQPCLRTSDKYPPSVRVKMNLQGFSATKFWDEAGKATTAPASWTGCSVWPRIRIKGLWFMAKQFGIVLELSDAKVRQVETECPFEVETECPFEE